MSVTLICLLIVIVILCTKIYLLPRDNRSLYCENRTLIRIIEETPND